MQNVHFYDISYQISCVKFTQIMFRMHKMSAMQWTLAKVNHCSLKCH